MKRSHSACGGRHSARRKRLYIAKTAYDGIFRGMALPGKMQCGQWSAWPSSSSPSRSSSCPCTSTWRWVCTTAVSWAAWPSPCCWAARATSSVLSSTASTSAPTKRGASGGASLSASSAGLSGSSLSLSFSSPLSTSPTTCRSSTSCQDQGSSSTPTATASTWCRLKNLSKPTPSTMAPHRFRLIPLPPLARSTKVRSTRVWNRMTERRQLPLGSTTHPFPILSTQRRAPDFTSDLCGHALPSRHRTYRGFHCFDLIY